MSFLKDLAGMAKDKANDIKNNTSKEELMDIANDAQRSYSAGRKKEAGIKVAEGLGKLITKK